ncbi:glyoxalase/bleomycin resistance protein/dioxygenase [Fictibacillus macauensis ZFHKF-1]|uniref:Glyoxalase/bleomycin resistance protein/dioxygenase n=1 Tax=Fictibacillus macauensis ZFHKF-1 TaxID=1196324 RepID=I8IZF5_9BACL|nr:VOC family protein [Fictibacillus macauensis]EIT84881.1 glyoxalase/bleomycin resistance protein/dioxygenase [Fictibacillus macauensis ZFHKF-1]
MIKGLYEAHLPVTNLQVSIEFYQKLGLKLYKHTSKVAFFWISEGESWLGLWEGAEASIPYHVSLRHIAFQVDLEDIKQAKAWLEERGINVRATFGLEPKEPIVIPNQAHAMIYFDDPDGNHLEFITRLPQEIDRSDKLYLSEFENLYLSKK